MTNTISLSGSDWLFKEFYGEDWRWRNAHKPKTGDTRHWRVGSVPGSVQHDLWRAGEIPNPYFERNSLLIEWIPARTWIYKKTFFAPEDLRGKRIQLHFEGVDYEAEFFLNGESLGTQRGMFTPVNFEVQDQLRYGEQNLIAVVIEAAPHEQPQVSRTSKVRTHKSRMTYWWDFCPRMIHIGIWDSVYLRVTEAVRIEDVFVRPQLSPDFQHADVHVELALDALYAQNVMIDLDLRLDGVTVARQKMTRQLDTGANTLTQNLPIDNPRLWWVNGHGDQPLYDAHVRVYADDSPSDQRVVRFGIRHIEWMPNETPDPTARPYTIVINGRKIYAKGWNWVPMDVLYGVPRPEKLDHLLELAQRAHVNLLRVWGGGLIEKEAFYNRCDELGIMVWQEFIQSSSGIENTPSDAPEFIDMLVREAEQIIPRKRNHPALVVWCGGNELNADDQPLDDRHPLLAALKAVVNRLDPDRVWLPTSPTGRVFMNSLENIERDPHSLHDVHGPWEYQGVTKQYELYNQSTSLLHSEFGVEGVTNRQTLDATMAPEHQLPPTLDNPIWQHLGAWWNQQPSWTATFGEIRGIDALIHATQFLQAEGLRYAVEADRRRKYQNSGTLPWQFNEPYPMATCTSAVDYYGSPKPSYYAVARAYEPIHVSAKFPTIAWAVQPTFQAQIWLNNSRMSAISDAGLTARIVGFSGQVYAEWSYNVGCPVNSAALIGAVDWSMAALAEAVFWLDLQITDAQTGLLSKNRYPFTRAENLAPLLTLPPTQISVETSQDGDRWRVHILNEGDATAFGVWLEAPLDVNSVQRVYLSDNHFSLFPQESKTIKVEWRSSPRERQHLQMTGWNSN